MKKQYQEPIFRRVKGEGLFKKYSVTRVDGEPVDVPCFVMELHPKESVCLALEAYAQGVNVDNPALAMDLERKVVELRATLLSTQREPGEVLTEGNALSGVKEEILERLSSMGFLGDDPEDGNAIGDAIEAALSPYILSAQREPGERPLTKSEERTLVDPNIPLHEKAEILQPIQREPGEDWGEEPGIPVGMASKIQAQMREPDDPTQRERDSEADIRLVCGYARDKIKRDPECCDKYEEAIERLLQEPDDG